MAPPKQKNKEEEEQTWRTHLEETVLDEETWTVKVVLFEAAGSEQDLIYLNKFETYAQEDKRFVIKTICKTETMFMINQLGGDKKVRDESFRVFEEGQAYLKDKKDIPADLLALIIKHLILKMKDEYIFIRRQKLEVKEGLIRESATMLENVELKAIKGKPREHGVTSPKNKKLKSETSTSQLTAPEPATDGKKYNTVLRERGEEWRDRVFVDDYPLDGPNIYVAISGFTESELPVCLARIGIPLVAVVQIRIDCNTVRVPSSLTRASKRGHSQTEVILERIVKFWEGLQKLRIDPATADDLKNTAFITFSPPYWPDDPLTGSPEKIYDELCFLMYDVQDLCRQHKHFLGKMDVSEVAQSDNDTFPEILYYHLMEELPLESVTIYSLLDSVLHAVCKNMPENVSSSVISTNYTMNHSLPDVKAKQSKTEKANTLVNYLFDTLCKKESDKKKFRITYGEEYENYKTPPILKYGDFIKLNNFHLGNINLDNIIKSIAAFMPWHKLWVNQPQLKDENEMKVSLHVNLLLSCFAREDVEISEFKRLMHILACRKLYNNRSSLKKEHVQPKSINDFKKVYLKRTIYARPLPKCPSVASYGNGPQSFPSITKMESESLDVPQQTEPTEQTEEVQVNYLFDCPDISELVSAAEIANQKPNSHMIDDFEFFEDFTGTCAFQVLLEAFNQFNCIDYKYDEVTDAIVMMFYNSQNKDGIACDEWRCHLPTPLCLQDFFDFTLDEHYDWVQSEELKYDMNNAIRNKSEYKKMTDFLETSTCLGDPDVGTDLMMEGSLKDKQIQAQWAEEEHKQAVEAANSEKKLRQSNKGFFSGSRTSRAKSIDSRVAPSIVQEDEENPFIGYDLGDRRLEVFGKDMSFFSKDGTHISTFYTLFIPSNVEFIALNIVPGFGENGFWMHKMVGDNVSQETAKVCESILLNTKDQVMINLKKQYYQVPVITPDLPQTKSTTKHDKENLLLEEIEPVTITKNFYSFYVTWPNGLVTESVHDENSSKLSHIKQYYLSDSKVNEVEIMRCITLNGECIIFKSNGNIEVLTPDGSYIKITKCEKRIILPDIPSEPAVLEKQKSKMKHKLKDKKTSAKNLFQQEDKKIDNKPPEYELHIEEFEFIDTSGLRQKWVNEIPTDIERIGIKIATNYCLGEVFTRRLDGTNTLLNKDGQHVVTFPNNTRIVSQLVVEEDEVFVEWTDEEKEYFDMIDFDVLDDTAKSEMSQKSSKSYVSSSAGSKLGEEEMKRKERYDGFVSVQLVYSIEHVNYATVSINKPTGKITIDSPNNMSLTVDSNIHYEINLDESTCATFNGEDLHISYEACSKCKSYTTCDVAVSGKELSHDSIEDLKIKSWVQMKDSFNKNVIVDEEGNMEIIEPPQIYSQDINEESVHEGSMQTQEADNQSSRADWKSESSVTSHGKCHEMYQARNIRFIILERDLSCSELVHRALVEQYRRRCRWQPWCLMNDYDTFGDHRMLHSILMPINLTETEKWLMRSKLSDKPKTLTYKDLKKDSGKGFYHWMRPYERFVPQPMKPEPPLSQHFPKAYTLRTLEQQWTDKDREELKGAKELLTAILRYRQLVEEESENILNIPIVDLRTDDERNMDKALQALGHRLYNEMKKNQEESLQNWVKIDITTRPRPTYVDEELSLEGEFEEEPDPETKLLKEREAMVKDVEETSKMNPNLQRYWRRRAEELKEEEFYLCLLRDGSVPPYFNNIIAGAIWWEINHTAETAVTKSESKKMTCVCAEGEGTSSAPEESAPVTATDMMI